MIEALSHSRSKRLDDFQIKASSSSKEEEKLAEALSKNHERAEEEADKRNKKELKSTKDLLDRYSKKENYTDKDKKIVEDLTNSAELVEESDKANKVSLSEVFNKIKDIRENSPSKRLKQFGKTTGKFLEDAAFLAGKIFSIGHGLFGLMGEGFQNLLDAHPKKKIEENDGILDKLGKYLFNKGRKAGIFLGNIFGGDFKDDPNDDEITIEDITGKKDRAKLYPDFTKTINSVNNQESVDYWDYAREVASDYVKFENDATIKELIQTLNKNVQVSGYDNFWSNSTASWIKNNYATINKNGKLIFNSEITKLIKEHPEYKKIFQVVLDYKIKQYNLEKKLTQFIMSNIPEHEKQVLINDGVEAWHKYANVDLLLDFEHQKKSLDKGLYDVQTVTDKEGKSYLIGLANNVNPEDIKYLGEDISEKGLNNAVNENTMNTTTMNRNVVVVNPGVDVYNLIKYNNALTKDSFEVYNQDNRDILDYTFDGEDTEVNPVYIDTSELDGAYYQKQEVATEKDTKLITTASIEETATTDAAYTGIPSDNHTIDNTDSLKLNVIPNITAECDQTNTDNSNLVVDVEEAVYKGYNDLLTKQDNDKINK